MAAQRVLVVDDQHDVRRVLSTGIRTLGAAIEVVEIPSGEEAMLEATRRPVDLVVSDIRLPGISGLELISRLRKRTPNARVILVTGVEDPKVRRQVADAGADAFFYKPIHMADFLDAVERSLGLVETTFPMPPVIAETVTVVTPPPTPAELIADLRHEVGAIAILLIDMMGDVIARSGDLPADTLEAEWLKAVVAAMGTSNKLAHLVKGAIPDGFWCLNGQVHSLCMVHVGRSHAALIAARPPFPTEQLKLIQRFAHELNLDAPALSLEEGVELLTEIPAEVLSEQALSMEELPLELLPELDALFANADQLKTRDLDAFWDTAADQGTPEGVYTAKTITFDQALKLGLTPENEKAEK